MSFVEKFAETKLLIWSSLHCHQNISFHVDEDSNVLNLANILFMILYKKEAGHLIVEILDADSVTLFRQTGVDESATNVTNVLR